MPDSVLVVPGPDGPRVLDAAAPLLRADDLGVLRGESVFETLRVVGGRAALVDQHLDRLARSAAQVEVEVPAGLPAVVACAAGTWGAREDGVLRVVVTKGPGTGGGTAFALVSAVPPAVRAARDGVTAVVLPLGVPAGLRATAGWLLGGVKSTSYAVAMAALREAGARGADDAVWASGDGGPGSEVLEGPTATVAWVRDGALVSPPADEVGILPGTTWDLARQLHDGPVHEQRAAVEDVRAADEVLLLSSVRGVAPVLRLDGRPVGAGVVGPVARRLGAALEDALRTA